MPKGDGTGPVGMWAPDGRGAGCRAGARLCFARRSGGENEQALLKNQAEALKTRLNAIQQRLNALEKTG